MEHKNVAGNQGKATEPEVKSLWTQKRLSST